MRMKSNDHLDDLMPELREQHRSTEAPAALEPLLRAAAEHASASRIPSRRRPAMAWALATATLILAIAGVLAWSIYSTRTGAPLQTAHHPASPPPPATNHATQDAPLQAVATAPVRHAHTPKRAANTDSQSVWQTEFVALPASEGLPPATSISLVRMQIQQSALQQYGLEIPAESSAQTLLAEFMVGEDGLPRAVRIVQ